MPGERGALRRGYGSLVLTSSTHQWPLIEPDLPARINLVFSQSNAVGAHLCVPSHKASGNPTWLQPGKYRLTVRVSAEGVSAVEERFIVRVTGAWSGLEVAVAQ